MPAHTIRDMYELTPLQQGMLFHSLLDPEERLYFEQISVPFSGAVNWSAFQQAWQDLSTHHDALRTSFHWQAIDKPIQVVHEEAKLRVNPVDLLGAPSDRRDAIVAEFLAADRAEGFDLARPPLFRTALLRTAPDDYRLVLSFHHLILDGWSLQLLLRDFADAYQGRTQGVSPRLQSAGRYRSYLLWLQAQDMTAAEAYWREALVGYGGPTPLWHADNLTDQASFGDHEVLLTEEATTALETAASRSRLTLSTVAHGAWALVLALSTGADDQVLGVIVSGRPAELPGVESMVGLFINTVPLRAQVEPDALVVDWLARMQQRLIDARQFEYTPLVEIQRWSGLPAGTTLFDSIAAFENYPVVAATRGPSQASATFAERTNYPLSAIIVPGPRLRLRLLFDRRHFDDATIQRLADRFEMIVGSLGRDLCCRVRDFPTMTPSDAAIASALNDPPSPPPDLTVHNLFERRAEEHPDAVALEFGGRTWTYRDVDELANELAEQLRARGVTPGGRVALLIDRSPELVVAMLATLKAGAAYVPLDSSNPPTRLRSIRADTAAVVTVTTGHLAEVANDLGAPTVLVDIDSARRPSTCSPAIPTSGGAHQAAYVMYTSGSTGEPKGIVVPHRAINRLVLGADYVQLGSEDRVGHLSNCSFDASTFEIWGPLLTGGRVVGIDRDTALTPSHLAACLEDRGITVLFVTTALFNRIAAEMPTAFRTLRVLLFGGEAVDPKSVRRVLEAGPPERLLHVYGPTESTTFATWHEVTTARRDTSAILIGRAIANTSVHVFDREMRPVPVGAVGELHIGGLGLADGYLGRPAMTAEHFVPDPAAPSPGARLYRTGDRVRLQPQGLEFVGRVDEQIKLRGFRIEPGEIEQVLDRHPNVDACAVVLRTSPDGEKRLVAYVGADPASRDAAGAGTVDIGVAELLGELGEILRENLPIYMHPSVIIVQPRLPLNSNGKIDRGALPDSETASPWSADEPVAPRSATEQKLATIWCEVLGLESIGVRDDFFEFGGHSLRATQLLSRIRMVFETEIELRAVFEAPTIEELARRLDATDASRSADDRITAAPRTARLQPVGHVADRDGHGGQ